MRRLRKNEDYPYIRAWGVLKNSRQDYIDDQIKEARKDNAPQTACFKREGTWVIFAEIESEETRNYLERIMYYS
jgi:hypothetical protein